MPKYRVIFWLHFNVAYEVEAADKDAARIEASSQLDQETDGEMIEHANNEPEVVDSFVEEIS